MRVPPERRVVIRPGALRRTDAAEYCGVGTTTFDRMVSEGSLPRARRYPNCDRLVWLTRELDQALDDLPAVGETEVDVWKDVKL